MRWLVLALALGACDANVRVLTDRVDNHEERMQDVERAAQEHGLTLRRLQNQINALETALAAGKAEKKAFLGR